MKEKSRVRISSQDSDFEKRMKIKMFLYHLDGLSLEDTTNMSKDWEEIEYLNNHYENYIKGN